MHLLLLSAFLLLHTGETLSTEADIPPLEVDLIVQEEPPSPPILPPEPIQPAPPPKPVLKPPAPAPIAAPTPEPAVAEQSVVAPSAPTVTDEAVQAVLPAALPPSPPRISAEAAHQTYAQLLWRHILLFKPLKLRQEGTVVATILLGADGRLISAEISSSSGSERLDAATLDTLRRAQPFPPRPPGLGRDPVRFAIPFQFEFRSP